MSATAKLTFELENAAQIMEVIRALKEVAGNQGGTPSMSMGPGISSSSSQGTAGGPAPVVPPPPTSSFHQNAGASPMALPQNTAPYAYAMQNVSQGAVWTPSGTVPVAFDPTVGRYFNPQDGSYFLGPANGGGAPPKPAEPSTWGAIGSVAGVWGVHQMVSQAGAGMNAYSSSVVGGEPFYPQRLIPGGLTAGGGVIGAVLGGLIGSVVPGAGTAVGAGIGLGLGSAIGGAAGSAVSPFIEHDISTARLNIIAQSRGLAPTSDPSFNFDWRRSLDAAMIGTMIMPGIGSTAGIADAIGQFMTRKVTPNDILEERMSQDLSGMMLSDSTNSSIAKIFPNSPENRKAFTDALKRAAYSPGAIKAYGDPANVNGHAEEILENFSYGNEDAAASALASLGTKSARDAAAVLRAKGFARVNVEDEVEAASSAVGVASYGFERAGRYQGSAAMRGQAGSMLSAVSAASSAIRREAALQTDPGKRAAMLNQAALMDAQASDQAVDAPWNLAVQEAGASGALAIGRSSRAFDAALYSGASASALPWGQKTAAMMSEASDLRRLMAERESQGRLSPLEKAQMTEQIEGLEFQATTGVSKSREDMVNQEKVSTAGLEIAKRRSAEMPGIIQGSAVTQTRELDLQAEAMAKQKAVLEDILKTSQYLTHEQRTQLQTQVENLKVSEKQAELAAGNARAAATYMTTETHGIISSVGSSVALISGAGGAAGAAAQLSLYGVSQTNVAAKQAEIQDFLARGYSPDSKEVQGLQRELSSMQVGLAQQQRGLAVAPMSGTDSARRSNLSALMSFYQAGYGSFGDIRGTLLGQVNMAEKRVKELSANRDKLRGQGLWTEGMEADFTEARNAAAVEGLQAAEAYSNGWDQRLISEVLNVPQSGRLFMSQFTHREFAATGLFHRAFGGTEEQTRGARSMYPQFARMLGSGDPRNFRDDALAGVEPRGGSRFSGFGDIVNPSGSTSRSEVTIRVVVSDSDGRQLKSNAVIVAQGKTSLDFATNGAASRRSTP